MASSMRMSKVSTARPSATRPVVVVAATPSSRTARPASFQRTSPEALAQFRREVGSLTGAPASSSASSYTPASKPAAASPSSWRSESPAPSRPASAAPARPSSRTAKPANFQRTSPEALAQFRREVGSLTGAPAPSSASSYTPAKPAAAAPSPSSWRSEAPAPAPARPSSKSSKPASFQRTSPEALAAFRREMAR